MIAIKRLIALLLALVMMFSLCACGKKADAPSGAAEDNTAAAAEAADEKKTPSGDIIIIYTNDVHCGVDDNLGYRSVAALKSGLEKAGNRVLLVDSGDFSQGAMIGTVSKGIYPVDIMNELGYTISCIGNHDFDYGTEAFLKMTKEAEFPMVCCNFLDSDGNCVLPPYEIIEVNGLKIAFLGILTPTTPVSSTPAYFQNDDGSWKYSFCQGNDGQDLYDTVQKYADEAREKGADMVIALSHLGINASDNVYVSSAVIENTSGIDVFLDGHSHSVMEKELIKNKDGEKVICTQTGTKLQNIGILKISSNGDVDVGLVSDGGIGAFIDSLEQSYKEEMSKVVSRTSFDLTIEDPKTSLRAVRSAETNLGDLIADSYRIFTNADIGLLNGGGIRKTIPAGPVSLEVLNEVQPFGNTLSVVEATGQQIADALEFGARLLPQENGGFLQVSGLSCTIDVSVPSSVETDDDGMMTSIGETRRVKDIMVGNEKLDMAKTYKVASTSYVLLSNGDGMTAFEGAVPVLEVGPQDFQVCVEFIESNMSEGISDEYSDPYGQGRITIING